MSVLPTKPGDRVASSAFNSSKEPDAAASMAFASLFGQAWVQQQATGTPNYNPGSGTATSSTQTAELKPAQRDESAVLRPAEGGNAGDTQGSTAAVQDKPATRGDAVAGQAKDGKSSSGADKPQATAVTASQESATSSKSGTGAESDNPTGNTSGKTGQLSPEQAAIRRLQRMGKSVLPTTAGAAQDPGTAAARFGNMQAGAQRSSKGSADESLAGSSQAAVAGQQTRADAQLAATLPSDNAQVPAPVSDLLQGSQASLGLAATTTSSDPTSDAGKGSAASTLPLPNTLPGPLPNTLTAQPQAPTAQPGLSTDAQTQTSGSDSEAFKPAVDMAGSQSTSKPDTAALQMPKPTVGSESAKPAMSVATPVFLTTETNHLTSTGNSLRTAADMSRPMVNKATAGADGSSAALPAATASSADKSAAVQTISAQAVSAGAGSSTENNTAGRDGAQRQTGADLGATNASQPATRNAADRPRPQAFTLPGATVSGTESGSKLPNEAALAQATPSERTGAMQTPPALPPGLGLSLFQQVATRDETPKLVMSTPITEPGFADELHDTVQLVSTRGLQSVEITITPEELGPIKLKVEMKGKEADVSFEASHEQTRTLLAEAVPALRENLAQSGIELRNAWVDRGPGFGGAGPGQSGAGQGQNQQQGNPGNANNRLGNSTDKDTGLASTGAPAQRPPRNSNSLLDTYA
jgi:flagellar hook-length control protein FliK